MSTLQQKVVRTTKHALHTGALKSIDTQIEVINENGIPFLLRTLANLKRKDNAAKRLKQAGETTHNPFLPYEQDLYVDELGDQHVCLLNKFNVVDHHLLIVTKAFESQENLINQNDFYALALCMQEIDGLAFFNGGTQAGASQPHKHLQLIPLPMTPFQPLPFSDALATLPTDKVSCADALHFNHAGILLPEGIFDHPKQAAKQLTDTYLKLRKALALQDDGVLSTSAYNLLITRQWMLMVPRTAESAAGASFNALAFCGAILVKTPEQATNLKQHGLMPALQTLTTPPAA